MSFRIFMILKERIIAMIVAVNSSPYAKGMLQQMQTCIIKWHTNCVLSQFCYDCGACWECSDAILSTNVEKRFVGESRAPPLWDFLVDDIGSKI